MTAERLIKILSRMPKGAIVRFKDYGSDQNLWCRVTWVKYEKGRGIKLDEKKEEPSEWEYLVP
jgi:hypothetical protein